MVTKLLATFALAAMTLAVAPQPYKGVRSTVSATECNPSRDLRSIRIGHDRGYRPHHRSWRAHLGWRGEHRNNNAISPNTATGLPRQIQLMLRFNF
jgi:hypothetical protein